MSDIYIPQRFSFNQDENVDNSPFNKILVSHNGIAISSDSKHFIIDPGKFDFYSSSSFNKAILYSGVLYFQDNLLPNLSVSRNVIRSLNFEIIAHLMYSTRILNEYIDKDYNNYSYFDRITEWDTYFTVKIIKASNFYESSNSFWDNQELIYTDQGVLSVIKAKEHVQNDDIKALALRC